MPEISRFFGIVIRMFVEAGGSHRLLPGSGRYLHIERIEWLAGALSRRQERLVLAWAELHQEELSQGNTCLKPNRRG
jgi:hypothetical protein